MQLASSSWVWFGVLCNANFLQISAKVHETDFITEYRQFTISYVINGTSTHEERTHTQPFRSAYCSLCFPFKWPFICNFWQLCDCRWILNEVRSRMRPNGSLKAIPILSVKCVCLSEDGESKSEKSLRNRSKSDWNQSRYSIVQPMRILFGHLLGQREVMKIIENKK